MTACPTRHCAACSTITAAATGSRTAGAFFRVAEAPATAERPHGIKYSFTLHDVDRTRLLGFDNAHGLPRVQAYDHRHRFRRTAELVPYDYQGTDELICDFFAAVEMACRQEGVPFEFEAEDVEREPEDEDGAQEPV